jgi:hydroxymethylbilane synthase
MKRSSALKVAGKTDQASSAALSLVIDALNESADKTMFVDYAGQAGGSKPVGDAGSLISLVSRGRADIGVIDAGELPLKLSRKVEIGAVMRRGNPFNVIVSATGEILDEMSPDALIAIGDHALRGQILSYRDDIGLVYVSGGYEALRTTLDRGEAGAFIARAWEVEMLGRQDEVVEVFTSSICMPPAGQGAPVLLIRGDDRKAAAAVLEVNHSPSLAEIGLERMLLGAICRDGSPGVGVIAEFEGDEFELSAVMVSPDGSRKIECGMHGWKGDELKVVEDIVADLYDRGGGEIIDMYRDTTED